MSVTYYTCTIDPLYITVRARKESDTNDKTKEDRTSDDKTPDDKTPDDKSKENKSKPINNNGEFEGIGYITGSPGVGLVSLSVKQEYRRRGIGQQLLRYYEDAVKRCTREMSVRFTCSSDNKEALALYEKQGYTFTRDIDDESSIGDLICSKSCDSIHLLEKPLVPIKRIEIDISTLLELFPNSFQKA